MYKSKLLSLLDDEDFGKDAINFETGLVLNSDKTEAANFLVFQFIDYYHVYLNLCDNGEAPFRDILVDGIASTLEEAQEIAISNLQRKVHENIN